ncbi:hypothetical protein K525DRAFT_269491 [Schizophyllum commune Loenen D]|nr:hypothetical protein K525DRAFT_269491 [Schizophyllum commune Loenen D]
MSAPRPCTHPSCSTCADFVSAEAYGQIGGDTDDELCLSCGHRLADHPIVAGLRHGFKGGCAATGCREFEASDDTILHPQTECANIICGRPWSEHANRLHRRARPSQPPPPPSQYQGPASQPPPPSQYQGPGSQPFAISQASQQPYAARSSASQPYANISVTPWAPPSQFASSAALSSLSTSSANSQRMSSRGGSTSAAFPDSFLSPVNMASRARTSIVRRAGGSQRAPAQSTRRSGASQPRLQPGPPANITYEVLYVPAHINGHNQPGPESPLGRLRIPDTDLGGFVDHMRNNNLTFDFVAQPHPFGSSLFPQLNTAVVNFMNLPGSQYHVEMPQGSIGTGNGSRYLDDACWSLCTNGRMTGTAAGRLINLANVSINDFTVASFDKLNMLPHPRIEAGQAPKRLLIICAKGRLVRGDGHQCFARRVMFGYADKLSQLDAEDVDVCIDGCPTAATPPNPNIVPSPTRQVRSHAQTGSGQTSSDGSTEDAEIDGDDEFLLRRPSRRIRSPSPMVRSLRPRRQSDDWSPPPLSTLSDRNINARSLSPPSAHAPLPDNNASSEHAALPINLELPADTRVDIAIEIDTQAEAPAEPVDNLPTLDRRAVVTARLRDSTEDRRQLRGLKTRFVNTVVPIVALHVEVLVGDTDIIARTVIDACVSHKLDVPYEVPDGVSLLAFDYDRLLDGIRCFKVGPGIGPGTTIAVMASIKRLIFNDFDCWKRGNEDGHVNWVFLNVPSSRERLAKAEVYGRLLMCLVAWSQAMPYPLSPVLLHLLITDNLTTFDDEEFIRCMSPHIFERDLRAWPAAGEPLTFHPGLALLTEDVLGVDLRVLLGMSEADREGMRLQLFARRLLGLSSGVDVAAICSHPDFVALRQGAEVVPDLKHVFRMDSTAEEALNLFKILGARRPQDPEEVIALVQNPVSGSPSFHSLHGDNAHAILTAFFDKLRSYLRGCGHPGHPDVVSAVGQESWTENRNNPVLRANLLMMVMYADVVLPSPDEMRNKIQFQLQCPRSGLQTEYALLNNHTCSSTIDVNVSDELLAAILADAMGPFEHLMHMSLWVNAANEFNTV